MLLVRTCDPIIPISFRPLSETLSPINADLKLTQTDDKK
jgi:hypothetical protein